MHTPLVRHDDDDSLVGTEEIECGSLDFEVHEFLCCGYLKESMEGLKKSSCGKEGLPHEGMGKAKVTSLLFMHLGPLECIIPENMSFEELILV